MYQHSWVEINLDHLKYNIEQIMQFAPADRIMGVVKANAYGHTCRAVAPFLHRLGVRHFAVSNEYEAIDLRTHITDGTVLILGHIDAAAAATLAADDVTVALFDTDYAKKLNTAMAGKGRLKCHVKFDTGMGRLGFDCRKNLDSAALKQNLAELFCLENLQITGAFTHFAAADHDGDGDGTFTAGQQNRFAAACDILKQCAEESGCFTDFCFHSANSAATLLNTDFSTDLYRAGIIMYGLEPATGLDIPKLRPVMSFKTIVSQVKTLNTGESVSYGRTFTAQKPMRVATIAVGYADGYMRAFSGKAYVVIRSVRCPLIGRICMDQAMVDVSALENVCEGDEVELFGSNLPVTELAGLIGTINYELVCAVSHRVPRVIIEQGKTVDVVRYESY